MTSSSGLYCAIRGNKMGRHLLLATVLHTARVSFHNLLPHQYLLKYPSPERSRTHTWKTTRARTTPLTSCGEKNVIRRWRGRCILSRGNSLNALDLTVKNIQAFPHDMPTCIHTFYHRRIRPGDQVTQRGRQSCQIGDQSIRGTASMWLSRGVYRRFMRAYLSAYVFAYWPAGHQADDG